MSSLTRTTDVNPDVPGKGVCPRFLDTKPARQPGSTHTGTSVTWAIWDKNRGTEEEVGTEGSL